MIELDRFDIAILERLQRDARLSSVAMAETVHLSASQVARRLRRLEEAGLVRRYAALLEPAAVGLGLMAFTHVSLDVQTKQAMRAFQSAVLALDDVLECYATTGDSDYLLKMVAADLAAFSDLLMNHVMPLPHVRTVRSSIVLNELKATTVLRLRDAAS